MLAVLRECCASRRSALVVAVGHNAVHDAVFEAVSEEVLTLELKDADAQNFFQHRSLVFVIFEMPKGANAFMVHVRDVDCDDDVARLQLLPPTTALSAQGRAVFRIPLIADHGLQVRILLGERRSVPARPVDVSVAGIQLEFEPAADPEMLVGDMVCIELSHASGDVQLNGLVRRRAGSCYGFSFPGCMTDGELSPRPDLQEMVAALQRHWLEHRD